MLPGSEKKISKKYINDKRKIITTAFVGKDGQEQYELTIKFGAKALSKYAKDLKITECIPVPTDNDKYEIDIANKKITVYLL